MRGAVLGEHPEIDWPLSERSVPPTPAALDLIEFLYRHASEPTQIRYLQYQGHHHVSFNRKDGQDAFRAQINTILTRSGLAYVLNKDGRAERLLEPPLEQQLRQGLPATGDDDLDELVALAEAKFLDPDSQTARDALEKLWDAFERAKSVLNPANKQLSARALAEVSTTTGAAAKTNRGRDARAHDGRQRVSHPPSRDDEA